MGEHLGLGIAAGRDPGEMAGLARQVEELGYASIWTNDHPAGDGLAQLRAWARESNDIQLGVGVLALDRHQPMEIAARVLELGLPLDRVLLGVGAGFTSSPLQVVRDGVAGLRAALPGARVAVAAMGPRMCRLAGEIGDAVLLNWMTPERAAWARPLIEEGARDASRPPADVRVYGYVRTALGADAAERLQREAGTYWQMPHYRRHFDAMGVSPGSVGIAATAPPGVAEGIQSYSALDQPVVRVLSHRAAPDILAVARAAVGA